MGSLAAIIVKNTVAPDDDRLSMISQNFRKIAGSPAVSKMGPFFLANRGGGIGRVLGKNRTRERLGGILPKMGNP